MQIDERLLDPNGEAENIENFNRVLKIIDASESTGVSIDDTLTKKGAAADAKAAGDRIKTLEGKVVEATASTAGLISAADKSKLDGIAANANNYTLPAASTGAIGGVKKVATVAKATGETPTKAEFDALIDALVSTGIMG